MSAAVLPPSSWGMRPATLRPRKLAAIRRGVVHHDAIDAPDDHADCPSRVAAHDDYHRDHNGWAAIGYHRVTCPHGTTYTGRRLATVGAHSEPANVNGVGYCLMGAGKRPATPAQLRGLARAIAYDERKIGRALSLTDHRMVEPGSTSCPGDGMERQLPALRVLVEAERRPKPKPKPAAPKPKRKPLRAPKFPGPGAFRIGRRHPAVLALGRQLVRLGMGRYHDGDGYQPGPEFTGYDRRNVARFQRSRPELRADPDGIPGPLTWKLLHTLPGGKR